MLTNSHFTGSQHINSVAPQSFALSREKTYSPLSELVFSREFGLRDPLLIRGKIKTEQALVLKATGILLGPQSTEGSAESHSDSNPLAADLLQGQCL